MTCQEQLQAQVNGVALALEAVSEGRYNFWTCEIVDDDTDMDETECNVDNYESDFDGGFERYFENVYGIEYRVDSQLRYKGAIIPVAIGGSTIYVDTCAGEVRGYWGLDKEVADIWRTTANALDDFFEEKYNCLRGCY